MRTARAPFTAPCVPALGSRTSVRSAQECSVRASSSLPARRRCCSPAYVRDAAMHDSLRTLAFRLGLAAAVLPALDLAFLRPPPGTTAGDHLGGGLAPALVAVAAGAAY